MQAHTAVPAATVNDQRYLAKLRTHWKANKSFPSLAKLADLLGMSSTGLGCCRCEGHLGKVEVQTGSSPLALCFCCAPLVL